jgi:hypothetical protein
VPFTLSQLKKKVFSEFEAKPNIIPSYAALFVAIIFLLAPLIRFAELPGGRQWDILSFRWEMLFLFVYPNIGSIFLLGFLFKLLKRLKIKLK